MAATRHAFFTSEFLAQLERLSLLSRRIFRGRVKGERRSLRRGHSVEFCDYRAYGVGDDLRYVDWNIYGRLDRLHVDRLRHAHQARLRRAAGGGPRVRRLDEPGAGGRGGVARASGRGLAAD